MALFSRGESKYELGKYASALDDFENITARNYEGQKNVNIGLCYYNLGLYDDAEKKFFEAIYCSSELGDAYYNLAVLYNNEDKRDKSKKLLNACLNIDRNSRSARNAIKKLYSEQSDWYDWWFGTSRVKKLFGVGMIVSIAALIITAAYVSIGIGSVATVVTQNVTKKNITSGNIMTVVTQNVTKGNQTTASNNNVTGLVVLAGVLLVMLLLPSSRRIKVAGVELASDFLFIRMWN